VVKLKVSVATIFCVVGNYQNLRQAVFANRGIALASSKTRHPPNAFNLIRQAEVLSRAGHGGASQQFEDVSPFKAKKVP